MTITKQRHIPSGTVEYKPEIAGYDSLGVAYVDLEKKTAIMYAGKSSKPVFYNRFHSVEDMKKKINGTFAGLMSYQDLKAQRKEARKAGHTLKVGDILYSSWGYDQTNVNFYQVIGVVGVHTVQVREIASQCVSNNGPTTHVVAVKDKFLEPRGEYDKTGTVLTRRASSGNRVKVSDCQTAYPWDGKPQYETGLGWGH